MSLLPNPATIEPHASTNIAPTGCESRFRLRPIRRPQDNLKAREWLVHNLIAKRSLVVLYGQPGAGKSTAALGLACCLATGSDWMGGQSQQCAAVYIGLEGREGLSLRIAAWEKLHDKTPEDAHLLQPDSPDFNFFQPGEADELIEVLKDMSKEKAIGVIIIDTLSDAMPGQDENTQSVMSKVVQVCNWLIEATDAAVILIHHPNRSNSQAPRGNSVLTGRADTMLLVEKDGSNTCSMTVKKQRDGKQGHKFNFRLKMVEIEVMGGQTETACAVEFVEQTTPSTRTGPQNSTRPVNREEERLLELIHTMKPVGADYRAEAKGETHFWVPIEDVKHRAISTLYSDAPSVDAQRKRFERNLKKLQGDGLVELDQNTPRIRILPRQQ